MARPLPADLCRRLARLLPMLSSDQPGEVVSAAAAITRTLKLAERDWHDLTAQLVAAPLSYRTPRKAPPSAGQQGSQAIDGEYIRELIDNIHASRCYLSRKAEAFLDQLEERAVTFGLVYFTPRQWEWFIKLLQAAGTEMEA